jgi:hypothetical protein
MSRRPLAVREAVIALAERGHIADVDLAGAHLKISWTANGSRRLLIISTTPSDRRAQIESRVLLRRLLRQEECP